LEAGQAYCDIDKVQLHELLVSLQPKVGQLANVLSLEVGDELDYMQVLIAAHKQMSELTEAAFGATPVKSTESLPTSDSLLQEAVQLRAAMDGFLHRSPSIGEVPQPIPMFSVKKAHQQPAEQWPSQFVHWITLIAGTCRARRQPLSVVMLEISDATPGLDVDKSMISQLLDAICREECPNNTLMERNAAWRRTVVLPLCDKQGAVRLAQAMIRSVERSFARLDNLGGKVKEVVSVGIASVTLPSKSFRPIDLLLTAERCLSAARVSETSVVKSLEIY
jgi:hypothetical protein